MKAGWRSARLGEAVEAVLTGPFGSILHKSDYEKDGIPLVNPANIVDEQIALDGIKLVGFQKAKSLKSYELRLGDIVIGRRGEIGRCAVVANEQVGWLCGTGSFIIRPGKLFDPRFLAAMLRSPACVAELVKAAAGATMQNLSNGSLSNLSVAVPSLDEQRRIVAVLDKAFAGIATATANAQKNLVNARALFDLYLASNFTAASKGCRLVPLSELATDITDGDHLPPPKTETGIPFITIGNIDKSLRKVDFQDTFRVSPAYYKALKGNRKPRRGDVLYTVTGSFGIPVLVEDDVEFCFQRHIGLVRPKPTTDSRWLCYLLRSSHVFEHPQHRANAPGH